MILYFSGTGNSEYTARRIGGLTDDEVASLFGKIRAKDYSEMKSEHPWVMVVPTYAWRIPRIVQEWMEKTKFSGSKDIYFVMTCGGNIGNAGKYLEKLCRRKGMNYQGCAEIVMPENYIALFQTPGRDEALEIIGRAEKNIDKTARHIRNREKLPGQKVSFGDKMSSGIVNDVFYPVFVHAKKFYATKECISCGKCVNVCPLENVSLKNGKPEWGARCTHCMACICKCPKEAVEYGKHSKGLPRYTCPK